MFGLQTARIESSVQTASGHQQGIINKWPEGVLSEASMFPSCL